jgi:hypothetical protein
MRMVAYAARDVTLTNAAAAKATKAAWAAKLSPAVGDRDIL